jgi:hypothetical protein
VESVTKKKYEESSSDNLILIRISARFPGKRMTNSHRTKSDSRTASELALSTNRLAECTDRLSGGLETVTHLHGTRIRSKTSPKQAKIGRVAWDNPIAFAVSFHDHLRVVANPQASGLRPGSERHYFSVGVPDAERGST